ncbi:MAG: undecaprenyl-diphosphate phosphatase [Opitutaceae bacterium]|nr:undecaprenyl-diphosphate phosphatase [Opitutaceae bacterium]
MIRYILLLSGITLSSMLYGATPNPEATFPETTPVETAPRLSFLDATILGVVEGITEFLPVSSTGHLILINNLLDLNGEQALRSKNGEILWVIPPSPENPEGVPLTSKLAANTYTIVIQAGAIGAVAFLYYSTILTILSGLLGRSTEGIRLFRNLIIAFCPAVAAGLLLEDWIDKYLFSVSTVVTALIVGGVLMLAMDWWWKRSASNTSELGTKKDLEPFQMTVLQSRFIGVMQCFALCPGSSRSMMTIVGGNLAGLSPAKAAEFSFLLGLPILTGAAIYKGYQNGGAMIAAYGWPQITWGCLIAAISAGFSVRWLVSYLNKHGLALFGIYRILLAIVVIAFLR